MLDQLQKLRTYFESGATRTYAFRKQQLKNLKSSILRHEKDLHDALHADLKKSPEESWVTETGFLISELNSALSNLRTWMKPQSTGTNLVNLPAKSFILKEPLGVVGVV